MIDSIGWIIKTYKASFFPIFKIHLMPFVTPLLDLGVMNMLRGQAICMIDDIIEHCGEAAQELVPTFLNHLVQGLEDVSPSVIQASAYGIGVSAEKCGAAFDPFCQPALEKMVHLINLSASTDDAEVLAARDNAVSAVAKIALAREGSVDVTKIWSVWLTWLPLRTDVLEARDVHARLLDLVEAGNPHILGAEYANLATLLKVFASILSTCCLCRSCHLELLVSNVSAVLPDDLRTVYDPTEEGTAGDEDDEELFIITDESKDKLRGVLAKLQAQLPAPVVQAAWAALSGDEQQALAHI